MADSGRAEIINMALLFANQDTILDPEGESKNAKLCAQFYDPTLQEALSGHPWSFALKASQLQLLAHKPRDVRFTYSYQLPEFLGRIHTTSSGMPINLNPENPFVTEITTSFQDNANSIPIPQYIIQGKELYSNAVRLQILYSRTDILPWEMTPQFKSYFAALLASKLFLKMTGGVDGFAALQQKVMQLRSEAKNTDSDQTDTTDPNRPNLFINARIY